MKTSFGAMTGRERLCFVLKYLFMALCVVVALFPIIWVILSSFKTNAEILSNGISLPTHFGFDGYQSALDMAPIFKFFGNIRACIACIAHNIYFFVFRKIKLINIYIFPKGIYFVFTLVYASLFKILIFSYIQNKHIIEVFFHQIFNSNFFHTLTFPVLKLNPLLLSLPL